MKKWVPVFVGVAAVATFAADHRDALAADAAAGKAKYKQFCSECYGQSGKGDGPAAASLNPKPRDHSDGKYMKTLSDEQITKITKMGGPAVGKSPTMPPWGGALSDADIKNVVAFIRTLAK
jgi:mono/diheme cytochrome c family protein|tara:strand:- start:137 stop:499 length:363 start_codon:yes stop_codon:yes gene_type:complete